MRELASFHAAQRGLSASTYGGDCGCGCNNCGEYAGDYGSKYWLPGGMPDWNYTFWGRDKYLGGGCPEYEKYVKEFQELSADYKALPRKFGNIWGNENERKAERIIEKAKKARERGKTALKDCERLKKKGEGKYDETTAAIEAGRAASGAGAAPTSSGDEEFKAALQQVAQSGGGGSASEGGGLDTKTLLIIGGVAVLGLGALFVLRKPAAPKKKAAAPAAAPVAAPAVVA